MITDRPTTEIPAVEAVRSTSGKARREAINRAISAGGEAAEAVTHLVGKEETNDGVARRNKKINPIQTK